MDSHAIEKEIVFPVPRSVIVAHDTYDQQDCQRIYVYTDPRRDCLVQYHMCHLLFKNVIQEKRLKKSVIIIS